MWNVQTKQYNIVIPNTKAFSKGNELQSKILFSIRISNFPQKKCATNVATATNHFSFSSLFSVAFALIFHKNHCKMYNNNVFVFPYSILFTFSTFQQHENLHIFSIRRDKYLQRPHICYIHFICFMA